MAKLPSDAVALQLAHFGCTPRESAIYLACLRHGPSTIQEIAKSLDSHRVTVHSAVEQLMKKGLLSETRRERRRLIVPESPDVLYRLLEQRENELRLVRAGLPTIVDFLSDIGEQYKGGPNLRYYRGVDGVKQMLEETFDASGEVLVIADIEQLQKLVQQDYLRDYYSRRGAKGISARLLWPRAPVVRHFAKDLKRFRMSVRHIKRTSKWEVALFSWNDSLAIMSLAAEQVTCTIIDSREISRFYRAVVFETLWETGTPLRA